MKVFEWRDGLRRGGSHALLFLARGREEMIPFRGDHAPGWCAVVGREPGPTGGKWASTTYRLKLAEGVRPLAIEPPVHGTVADELGGTWEAAADRLGVTVEALRGALNPSGPTARTFDERAAALASL